MFDSIVELGFIIGPVLVIGAFVVNKAAAYYDKKDRAEYVALRNTNAPE